ncbi:MAG TPA: CDP-diacylglycerol--serine O-phosphatidyltransferase [Spirochaetia bacterium]|nr:CDP-diacylglycerol--serine O-phosphatidyltransferase [Spirochaetia bacterium]
MRYDFVPNLVTGGNLVAGVLALAGVEQGRYALAAYLILAAVVLDGLDGKVARLLHISSDFGRELDSLADLVSFCVAPALLFYAGGLAGLGVPGLAAVVMMVLGGALRLARFNMGSPPGHFEGLPTTAAGGIAAGFWLLSGWLGLSVPPGVSAAVLAVLALLMVSRIRVPKF